MAITPSRGCALRSFVTQDLLEQLAEQLAAGVLVLGRQAFPEVGWPRVAKGLPGLAASALAGLLHGGLLWGWSRQQ
jgi:hypothetical protein